MFEETSGSYLAPRDATSGQLRISGAILLIVAVVVAAVFVVVLVNYDLARLLPVSMPVLILWFMGMHRVLWGGMAARTRGVGAARAAASGAVGFISLLAGSALLGFLLGLVHGIT